MPLIENETHFVFSPFHFQLFNTETRIFGNRADLNVGLLSREKTCIGYSVKAEDLV